MLCLNPINTNGQEAGCGQCGPCRTNAVREKTAQLILEHQHSLRSVMATLTYRDEDQPLVTHPEVNSRLSRREEKYYKDAMALAPVCPETPTLLKTHLRQIGNALRRHGYARHFGVGEYGTETGRPHYHFLVFGADPWVLKNCLEADGWSFGYIHTRPVTGSKQMAYTAGYTLKKQAEKTYLPGQEPETAIRPIGPALGMPYISTLAHWFSHQPFAKTRDVPRFFRYDGKLWPFSNYQRQKIRKMLGRDLLQNQCDLPDYYPTEYPVVSLEDRQIRWERNLKRQEIYRGQTQRL